MKQFILLAAALMIFTGCAAEGETPPLLKVRDAFKEMDDAFNERVDSFEAELRSASRDFDREFELRYKTFVDWSDDVERRIGIDEWP